MAEELRVHLDEQESARQAQGTEDARERAEDVNRLKFDTAAFLKELDAAHQAMTTEQRQRLAEDRAQLASDTGAFMEETHATNRQMASDVAEMRGELQADLSEAGRAWSSFAGQMQQHRAGRPVAAPPPPRPSSPSKEEGAADDLTAIQGIGPATQRRLNEAGFISYTQLARAVSADLHKAMGEAGQRINVEEWIEQAQELAELG